VFTKNQICSLGFYLIVTSVLGLVWIAALIEAVQIGGTFAVDHLLEYSLNRAPSAGLTFLSIKFSISVSFCNNDLTNAYVTYFTTM